MGALESVTAQYHSGKKKKKGGGLLSMAANLIPISSSPHSFFHSQYHYISINHTCWSHIQSPSINPLMKVKVKAKLIPLSSTPSASSLVEEEKSSTQAGITDEDAVKLPLSGCKACGREEIENGCNGEGRIQGGIATVPGFGWWPIKAYRPCPGFVESGGRYRRRGQSMDEVAWGRSEREVSLVSTDEVQLR
ncbi:hypothetical protein AQUCO_03700205v1 [Aquilegia coerulea]|uniref:Uncharacterized protein n=1 Tax=Aquilegia coerulea TaxID=218851 RepID=A0A2G5CU20_AQUCA|nr:hypothetical protein AQUCO_03700205v1 [Aquilegia coerulea]